MHKHKCGMTVFGQLPGFCGHEWEHDPDMPTGLAKTLQFAAEHMCPACGAGPFYHRLGDDIIIPANPE